MPDRIRDYATGKEVEQSAEEIVRQQFEHILVDELGYARDFIDIEFRIQRGAKVGSEKADIAVFKNKTKDQKNLYLVVETEPPGRPVDDQVFSYVTATTAEFAVWFDGLDARRSRGAKYFWRDLRRDPTKFIEIPALPRFGQTLEEIGQYKKSQLQPARSLKGLFQKMHNRLYGEGPLKREDAIAQEVIKLLFCKLYDELYTPGDTCEFRATVTELRTEKGRKQVGDRVRQLFLSLKRDPSYGPMFRGEDLQYDDYWISYIVSELQPFGLTHEGTDTDAIGDAYEIFVGPQLKGESGQFFTPRAVVKMAVDILKPSLVARESVIDPACGSGGFLIYSLRSIRAEALAVYKTHSPTWVNDPIREYTNNFIAGLDTEPLLYKVAKSYMAIIGNGKSGIFREDSLAPLELWQAPTRSRITLGTFDVLLTNPPFGTKIKVESPQTLEQYDLAHGLRNGRPYGLATRQDPAILFIERAWQLIRPEDAGGHGGRMAIVLPRQILSGHDASMMEIRNWILDHLRLIAIVDMPPETFRPYTGTITSVLFAERTDTPARENYEIFMAVAEHVGHDRRGNPLVARTAEGAPRYDEDNNPAIQNDLTAIAAAFHKFKLKTTFKSKSPSIFSIHVSDIRKQPRHRMDAWFYDPTKNDVVKQVWDLDGINGIQVRTIGELIRDPADVFYPGRHKRNYTRPGPDAVPFLSGTNVLQVRPFDVKWQSRKYKPMERHLVETGWILVTRSGSTGRVVYVGDDLAGFQIAEGVAVSEHVIRIIPDTEQVDPGYLFAYLSTEGVGKVLLAQGIYASVVRHITPEHIRAIPVPLPPAELQREVGDRVREAERRRGEANQIIRTTQVDLSEAVLGKDRS